MNQERHLLSPEERHDLDSLLEVGVLEALDYHFARAMAQLLPEPPPTEVLLGLALASRAIGLGHICAELKLLGKAQVLDREGRPVSIRLPAYPTWAAYLAASGLVSVDAAGPTPLVFDRKNGTLYLTRYWVYQQTLVKALGLRASRLEQVSGPDLQTGLRRYFPGNVLDHQRLAALLGVVRNFTVISGGPGTGKTSTVTRILALLLDLADAAGHYPPRVLLLAPTGKAAARLGESIKAEKAKLVAKGTLSAERAAAIPEDGSTIHRALGWVPERPTRFDHHEENPLAADVVLVDEASMVDLGLLAKLVAAVPSHARLILLGDKDQLASVEAGAILGDITGGNRAKINVYSQALVQHVAALTGDVLEPMPKGPAEIGIWDSMVHLTVSYRFNEKSGIGLLAKAIQRGSGDAVVTLLRDTRTNQELLFQERDIQLVPLSDHKQAEAALNRFIQDSFRPYLLAKSPEEALVQFDRARLLCAHRRGPLGVEYLNQYVERLLGEAKLINPRDPYYVGRPIMVTRNDYQFNLFNGDIGLIHRDPETGVPLVYFPTREGKARPLSPGHLPPHETVYAMTVHKSQGSEFNHIALLLPPEISPIVTRELIYTAVTRAKRKVTVFGDPEVLVKGIKERIKRASGLRDALWGGSQEPAPKAAENQQGGWQQLSLF